MADNGVSEKVVIVPYDEGSSEAHSRFAAKMWPSKLRRREERYNRWKFRGPDRGAVDGLLLALSGGEVLGQLGLIPAVVSVDGERLKCQWACDLMVDSSLRRRGIASRLFDAALARGIVTLGSNPSGAADVTMRRIGFGSITGPAIGVFPLDPAHVLSWKVPAGLRVVIPALGTALRPLFWWRGRRLWERRSIRTRTVAKGSWRIVAELVAEQQSRQAEPLIVHDEEFLAWRCSGLPGFAEPLEALRTEDGSYAIVGVATPYYYVFDWWASSWESARELFSTIRTIAIEAGGMTLQAYAQSSQEEEWLRMAGFLFLKRRCQILCEPPSRFLPRRSRMRYSIFDSDGNL